MEHDEGQLGDLLEESKDVHADAMAKTRAQLDEVVEIGRQERSRGALDRDEGFAFARDRRSALTSGVLGAGAVAGIGATILALGSVAAYAATPTDVQILQTAQSIENLAVATYGLALTLPFIGGAKANGVVKAFVTETRTQHMQHGEAFASAIRSLKGKVQPKADPVLAKVVAAAKPKLTSAGAVVALALELEQGAAETYVKDAALVKSAHAKNTLASIMGVEAQHVAVLLAVQALLAGGAAADIALPPPSLPAAAGGIGFPNAFYSTNQARPAMEGAVR